MNAKKLQRKKSSWKSCIFIHKTLPDLLRTFWTSSSCKIPWQPRHPIRIQLLRVQKRVNPFLGHLQLHNRRNYRWQHAQWKPQQVEQSHGDKDDGCGELTVEDLDEECVRGERNQERGEDHDETSD